MGLGGEEMRRGVLVALVLLFVAGWIAVGQELEQEEAECCPSRVAGTGIGAWFHQGMICAAIRHWPSEQRAMELDFCATPEPGRLNVFLRGLSKFSDTCILDLYMTGGFGFPIGGEIDWQRVEGAVGTEWCFPGITNLAISLEVGASILHRRTYWSGWHWESETFISGGVHFYFEI